MTRTIANPFVDDIQQALFTSSISNAISYDCMMGYFNTSSLTILAETILFFLNSNPRNKMRFIISPELSKHDLESLKTIYSNNLSLEPIIGNLTLTTNILEKETLIALAYLFKKDRIDIKLAIPKKGLFHVKCWLLKQSDGTEIVVHGSGNHTVGGLSKNFEYLVIENSKNSSAEKRIVNRIRNDFNLLWENKFPEVICVRLTLTTINLLLGLCDDRSLDQDSIIKNLSLALENQEILDNEFNMNKHSSSILSLDDYSPSDLYTPEWLDYRSGDYSHQGNAIDAWFANNKQGILSIATGGGKTLTSLTAATLLSKELDSLLLIIAVPTKALMEQWANEVALFGVRAINLNNYSTKNKKLDTIKKACKNLKFKSSRVEAIILSHDALKSDYIAEIEKRSEKIPVMLIADEVHNLGSEGFIKDPPQFFQYKIGLSATPIRQYDEDGSNILLDYFKGVVFDFSLKQAIGNCLVPFDYFVHKVYLSVDEEDQFYDLTQKIKKLSFAAQMDKKSEEFQAWSNLCIQRRKIIETAQGKISTFEEILENKKTDLSYSLIFCSDKNPEQLDTINQLLNNFHINYHQITGEETSNINLLNRLVEDYNLGILKVLTSKRVLDEGFNVPQTRSAYLLASNTTKKQWVQRLGRVLRKADNKTHAEIHDFLVLPAMTNIMDTEFIGLLRSEANRIRFFSEHARNGTEKYGSLEVLTELLDTIKELKEE